MTGSASCANKENTPNFWYYKNEEEFQCDKKNKCILDFFKIIN